MLAKRRSVSTRNASGWAAQAGQAARAAATSASGSPAAPVHNVSPVAGSIEVRVFAIGPVMAGARDFSSAERTDGPLSGALAHGLAHPPHRRDLGWSAQSSRSSIADQIASTSSMICIEQDASSDQ